MSDAGVAAERSGFAEIFRIYLRLGLTSFGGPVAHLGYFRTEFVQERKWLSDAAYADLMALCQFLPGPGSSQAGFAIGLMRGGWAGGIAAFLGFTLPSVLALIVFAYGAGSIGQGFGGGVIEGLKILAVAVVGHALLGMGRSLAPGGARLAIALAALFVLALWAHPLAQVGVILAGAAAGMVLGLGKADPAADAAGGAAPRSKVGLVLIAVVVGLLVLLPLAVAAGIGGQAMALFEAFYRAGALVFGGGHVVLPLLESSVVAPGWVSQDEFLAGYGAAQAVPGPMFSFAAFLGTVAEPAPNGVPGAIIALAGMFVPGLLLVAGVMPFWERLRAMERARAVLAGVNAAVVGVLAAAFYDPVFTSGVKDPLDFAIAASAFFALVVWKVQVWRVVLAVALLGGLAGLLGL